MTIFLEILVYLWWKTFLISKYLGVEVHVREGSYGLVIIESSCLLILCSYLLYSEMMSLIDSSNLSEGEVFKILFSREDHIHLFIVH